MTPSTSVWSQKINDSYCRFSVLPNLVTRILETLGTRLGCAKQGTRDDGTGVGDFHITSSLPYACWWTKTKDPSQSLFVRRSAIVKVTSFSGGHQGKPLSPILDVGVNPFLSRFIERLPWEIHSHPLL